jgi:hypothetical protein
MGCLAPRCHGSTAGTAFLGFGFGFGFGFDFVWPLALAFIWCQARTRTPHPVKISNKAKTSPPQDAHNYEMELFGPMLLLHWGLYLGPPPKAIFWLCVACCVLCVS